MVIENGWREAALMYERHLTDEDIQKHIHGHPGPYTIRTLFGDLPESDQQKVQAHIIHVENTTDCELIPGVASLIASLGEADIPVGIVTSGWRQKINRVIELLHAEPYISVIVERDDVTRGKPHPDPIFLLHNVWVFQQVRQLSSRMLKAALYQQLLRVVIALV